MNVKSNAMAGIDAAIKFSDRPRNSHDESVIVEGLKESRNAVAELVAAATGALEYIGGEEWDTPAYHPAAILRAALAQFGGGK